MKHIKTFENFDLDSSTEMDEQDYLTSKRRRFQEEEDCDACVGSENSEEEEKESNYYDNDYEFGDEGNFGGYKGPSSRGSRSSQEEITLERKKSGRSKPPVKKPTKKVEEEEEKEKGSKGLTAKQKKLPAGLLKAIEARKKK